MHMSPRRFITLCKPLDFVKIHPYITNVKIEAGRFPIAQEAQALVKSRYDSVG